MMIRLIGSRMKLPMSTWQVKMFPEKGPRKKGHRKRASLRMSVGMFGDHQIHARITTAGGFYSYESEQS
jgi:hypothetical protein